MNTNSNNVIAFKGPSSRRIEEDLLSVEQINANVELMKLYHIQEVLATLSPMIFSQLQLSGFSLNPEDIGVKDGAFIVESIRSLLCKHYGIHHPFQKIVEATLLDEETEESSFKIAESINLSLVEETAVN